MVVDDLVGPVDGSEEELDPSEDNMTGRYWVEMLAPRFTAVPSFLGVGDSPGNSGFSTGHSFHEAQPGVRHTVSESARLTFHRLLAPNRQRGGEEVKAGLHTKKSRGTKMKAEGQNHAALPQGELLPGPQSELSLE